MEIRLTLSEANVLRVVSPVDSISLSQLAVSSLTFPSELDAILEKLGSNGFARLSDAMLSLTPLGIQVRDKLLQSQEKAKATGAAVSASDSTGSEFLRAPMLSTGMIVGGVVGAVILGPVGWIGGALMALGAGVVGGAVGAAVGGLIEGESDELSVHIIQDNVLPTPELTAVGGGHPQH